jgi:hypothetical protein
MKYLVSNIRSKLYLLNILTIRHFKNGMKMGCKPNFLYNTGIRRSSEVLFLTGKLCILEEFP